MWRLAKLAIRPFRAAPKFASLTILTVALGVGSTTLAFSILDQTVLRPLPYPNANRLVVIRERAEALANVYPTIPANPAHFLAWSNQCTACAGMVAILPSQATLSGIGTPGQIGAVSVSGPMFSMFGARPLLGRLFSTNEESPSAIRGVVISERIWRLRFGGDSSAIGRSIVINESPMVVEGVVGNDFFFPKNAELGDLVPLPAQTDIYMPLTFTPEQRTEQTGDFSFAVIALLRPGATAREASAQINGIEARISRTLSDNQVVSARLTSLQECVVGRMRGRLLLLFGAVLAVLLIVCVNLANFNLSHQMSRTHTAAIRLAMGASMGRLVRDALSEAIGLALVGGILGIAIASTILRTVVAYAPPTIPRLTAVHMDWRIAIFGLCCAVVTGFMFGSLPAVRTTRIQPADVLKGGGRATGGLAWSRANTLLTAAQSALTSVLVVTTGLLVASYLHVTNADTGFVGKGVVALNITLPMPEFGSPTKQHEFFDHLLASARLSPGIQRIAIVSRLPLEGEANIDYVTTAPRAAVATDPTANVRFISSGYFSVLGTRLLDGRPFDEDDRSTPVAIVSRSVARQFWPHGAVLGRELRLGKDSVPVRIVGVAANVPISSLGDTTDLIIYVPYWQGWVRSATVVARAELPMQSVGQMIGLIAHSYAPSAPVDQLTTIPAILAKAIAPRRLEVWVLGGFASMALVIGGLGLFGVVSQSVGARRREFAVRLAVGARPADVYSLIMRRELAPVVVGCSIGIVSAHGLGAMLAANLFGIRTGDTVLSVLAMLGCLIGVAVAACVIPARRGARTGLRASLGSD